MGKKINVFRENDLEHLKAYLVEVVRDIVFSEEEGDEPETDKDAAVEAATNPEVVKRVLDLLRKNGYPNAAIQRDVTRGANQGTTAITNLGDKGQRQAIQNLLSDKGKEVAASSYKDVTVDGQRFIFGQGGASVSASGTAVKKNPNRGELSEAWMALAVTKRFMNLPSTAKVDKDGAVIEPAKGLVTPEEVIAFLESGQVKRTEGKEATMSFSGKAGLDTINMEVGLRGYSMDGLLDPETGKLGEFARTDKQSVAYLKGACEWANREVIKWAIGVAQNGAGEEDPSKAMGWFINKFENTINIRGVGTAAQSLTKVDMEMVCEGEGCPETMIRGGVGAVGSQLARLSLKAGEVKHFGGGAATSVERAIGVMESVFTGGKSHPDAVTWAQHHTKAGTFSGKDQKARTEALNKLVQMYVGHVQSKMAQGGLNSDEAFMKSMIEGLLQHSVKGKSSGKEGGKDFSEEAGVVLVQTTDAGDFYTLDFNNLPEVLGDGTNFAAKGIDTKGCVTYLVIYQAVGEGENGEPIKLPEPNKLKDDNILFWIRTLGRSGAEILRLEKGALMKNVIGVKKNQKLVYRDGRVVSVDDEDKTPSEPLEEKILAILKQGLNIS